MENSWILRDFEKEFPSFRLDAVKHEKVAFASELFSLQQVEEYLFVRVPVYIAREYELYQVDEIRCTAIPLEDPDSDSDSDRDSDSDSEEPETKLWEHDPKRIWYKFKSKLLNMETGYHTYRLSFKNLFNNDTCLLYIAYTIQNNKPDKPYMYMDRESRTCNCGNSNNS